MGPAGIVFRKATSDDAEPLSAFMDALAGEGGDTVSNARFTPAQKCEFLNSAATRERAFFLPAPGQPWSAAWTSGRRQKI